MAAGKIVRFETQGPAGAGLVVWPEIPAESLTAGKPVQRGHYYLEDKKHGLSAGVWDCTAVTTVMEPYAVNEFMIVLEGAVTIIDQEGGETTIKAGESFILPKGLPCVWKQTGYMRKFFVIFDDASGLAAKDPAALRVLRLDPGPALRPCDGPPAEMLLSAPPAQCAHEYFADLTGQWTVGAWDSTAFHRKTIDFPRHELMHILEGEIILTEEGQPPQTFRAGDTFFVPLGTRCGGQVTGYVRKIYCILQPKAAAAKKAAAE